MKRNFIIFMFFLLAIELYSEVFPVPVGNKYGYIDTNLKVYKQPIYEYATKFVDGIAVVKINGDCQIINSKFETIAHINAEYFEEPSCGYINFWDDNTTFYTDYSGNIVFSGYDNLDQFTDNYSIVQKFNNYPIPNDYYICDTKFKLTKIKFKLSRCSGFNNGLIYVTDLNHKTGYLNYKGEIVIPFEYSPLSFSFHNDLCLVVTEKNEPIGYIDKNNNYIIPRKYYWGTDVENNKVCVMYKEIYYKNTNRDSGCWKVIDINDNDIYYFPENIYIVDYSSNGICTYYYSDKEYPIRYGYIKENGEKITEPVFRERNEFTGLFTYNVYNDYDVLVDSNGKIYKLLDIFGIKDDIHAIWRD